MEMAEDGNIHGRDYKWLQQFCLKTGNNLHKSGLLNLLCGAGNLGQNSERLQTT
jgi:hypothetical protein